MAAASWSVKRRADLQPVGGDGRLHDFDFVGLRLWLRLRDLGRGCPVRDHRAWSALPSSLVVRLRQRRAARPPRSGPVRLRACCGRGAPPGTWRPRPGPRRPSTGSVSALCPAVSMMTSQAGAYSSDGRVKSTSSSCALKYSRKLTSVIRRPRASWPWMPSPLRNTPMDRPKPLSQSSGFMVVAVDVQPYDVRQPFALAAAAPAGRRRTGCGGRWGACAGAR